MPPGGRDRRRLEDGLRVRRLGVEPRAPLTSVQYNNGGVFAGDATFVFDNATKVVTVSDLTIADRAAAATTNSSRSTRRAS